MQGEPGKIDLGSINGIFSLLSSVTHCHQWRLLLSSRRARGRAAGLAAVVRRGGTGRNRDCDPALPKTPQLVLVPRWAARAWGAPRGRAGRDPLLVASRWELQLFRALLLAICKAACGCLGSFHLPEVQGAVPERLWPACGCGRCGSHQHGAVQGFEAPQHCLISAAVKGNVELKGETEAPFLCLFFSFT